MPRRLAVIPLLSLLLLLAIVAISARSDYVAYRLASDRAETQSDRIIRRDRSILLSAGNLNFTFATRYYPRGGTRVFNPQAIQQELYPVWMKQQPTVPWHWNNPIISSVGKGHGIDLLGLRAGQESWSFGPQDHYDAWRAVIPCWFLATLFAIPPIYWLARKAQSRRLLRSGHCPTCRYDLTANTTGVCPECGAAVAEKA